MTSTKFWTAAGKTLAVVAVTLIVVLTLASGAGAASKYKTLYRFKGGDDGRGTYASLTFDASGNLYSTTEGGGAYGLGTVFKLTPHENGKWTKSVLHSFNNGDGKDGRSPDAGVIFDSAGNLYGTTVFGGILNGCQGYGCGTVFKLAPNADGSWTESVLYSFNGTDGYRPYASLIFDASGNLYSTTAGGGAYGLGTVFKLTPHENGKWTENVVYSFKEDGKDGIMPNAGVIIDAEGNLYGTTIGGGRGRGPCDNGWGCGTVFKLTPNSNGTWTERVLHSFDKNGKDGFQSVANLLFDQAGNLYGTTQAGGRGSGPCNGWDTCGTVFKLAPNADGSWTERVLHSFKNDGKDGYRPLAALIFDQAGNLYGTARGGGAYGYGMVFKLTPNARGGWKETVLHSFNNHPDAQPRAGLIFDGHGNLYGTTEGATNWTFGTVFEITP